MCILYEIKLHFGMARCQAVKMWCIVKLHQPQFNSICLAAPLYFSLWGNRCRKACTQKTATVCNVDKPTTEEWTRGRHWHQTDMTEINRHKRSGQIKGGGAHSLAGPGLNSSHCACHRPRTARQRDSRSEMDAVPGACVVSGQDALITHHQPVQNRWIYLYIYILGIYYIPISRVCFFVFYS